MYLLPLPKLADEPTANLDTDSAADIMELFKAFHQVGVTVILATHDTQWVRQLNPRVLWVEQGQVRTPGEALPEGKA